MKKLIFSCFSIFCSSLFVIGCGNKSAKISKKEADTLSLIGKWTTQNPNDSSAVLGVELKANGTATSINMPTLPYDHWKKLNDSTITIHGISIFDGEKTELVDTFLLNTENQTLNQQHTDIVYQLAK